MGSWAEGDVARVLGLTFLRMVAHGGDNFLSFVDSGRFGCCASFYHRLAMLLIVYGNFN